MIGVIFLIGLNLNFFNFGSLFKNLRLYSFALNNEYRVFYDHDYDNVYVYNMPIYDLKTLIKNYICTHVVATLCIKPVYKSMPTMFNMMASL